MASARVYIVRHGETQENREGIIQGHLDTELNELGLVQARTVAEALRSAGIHFDIAYSSDLQRALKTAETILSHRDDIEIRREEALRERFLGRLQGHRAGHGVRASIAQAEDDVESASDFTARAVGWWKGAIMQRTMALAARETPYNVLVVSHGGFIGTLVKTLIGSGKAQCAPGVVISACLNTSVSILEVEKGGGVTVVQYGDVRHLEDGKAVEGNVDEHRSERKSGVL